MNKPKWVIWKAGLYWRFRLEASNGKVLLNSGNSYPSESTARSAIGTVGHLVKAEPDIALVR